MRITFDHQIFSLQNQGGISRYFFELIRELGGMDDLKVSLPMRFSNNRYLMSARPNPHRNFLERWRFAHKKYLIYLLNHPQGILALRGGGMEVFHPTYYDPYFLRHIGKKPFVLTVYDMIPELFPEEYSPRVDIRNRKRLLIRNANRIIAISENTKKDILRFHDVDPGKIHVIHLGDSLSDHRADPGPAPDVPDKYLLFVGLRGSYKNFDFFVESVAELFSRDRDLHLICVGGGTFSPRESALLERLGISRRALQVSPTDRELAHYYRKAAVFVFPSLYEGFGIPVLESLGGGCPLAVSSSSSLPEVAGDAAVYFDARDSGSILGVVRSLLDDSSLRNRLKTAGLERARLFSWELTAKKTRDLYLGMA